MPALPKDSKTALSFRHPGCPACTKRFSTGASSAAHAIGMGSHVSLTYLKSNKIPQKVVGSNILQPKSVQLHTPADLKPGFRQDFYDTARSVRSFRPKHGCGSFGWTEGGKGQHLVHGRMGLIGGEGSTQ